MPWYWHQEYAYSPRQGPNSRGRTHIVLDTAVQVGRMRRRCGDALCKPRDKFFGLSRECEPVPDEMVCPRCNELRERFSRKASRGRGPKD